LQGHWLFGLGLGIPNEDVLLPALVRSR
jgi:hypothetical protein